MKRILIAALIAALLPCASAHAAAPELMTGDILLFDFGASAEDGWIRVSADTKYKKDTGYGFSMVSFVEDTDVGGSGPLSDAVKVSYYDRNDTEFRVDLPDGMYEVSVYSGQIRYMNINMEGYPVIFNMEYPQNEARIELPVSDGCLNIGLDKGSSGTELSISALTVRRVGDLSSRRRRVFVLGDSTAATMYPLFLYPPLDEGYPGGWGQMLGGFLKDDVYAHNISSSGTGTKSYSDEELRRRLHFAEPGDYVLIALGINDYNSVTAREYKEELKRIAETVKELGAVPVLCSDAAQLKELKNGVFADMCYAKETGEVAEELGVAFIDLHAAHARYLEASGDAAESLFWRQWNGSRDMTHPNRNGAGHIARILAEELSALDGISAVSDCGISESPLLKCRLSKNALSLINTTDRELSVALISPEYVSKKLERVKVKTITLPPYDVTAPESAVTADLSGFNPGADIWLSAAEQSVRITYAERISLSRFARE